MISTAVVNYVLYQNCCHRHCCLLYTVHCINPAFAAIPNKPLLYIPSSLSSKFLVFIFYCFWYFGIQL